MYIQTDDKLVLFMGSMLPIGCMAYIIIIIHVHVHLYIKFL